MKQRKSPRFFKCLYEQLWTQSDKLNLELIKKIKDTK